jgi:pimeloyl-ACP methyl ester carboxylesterase
VDAEPNGRHVAVDVVGDGPPLLLVHSLLTDAAAFDGIVPQLAREHRVCRVSLPGFDGSTPLQDPTIFDLADLVADVMADLGLEAETSVLGNGLGGFVAVALAIRHGDRFDRLIAANCGAVFSPDRVKAFATMSRLVEEGGMAAVVDVAVRRIFPDDYLGRHPEVIEERREVLLRVDPGAFAAACRTLASMDLRPDLGSIQNPTLVVVGADDATTPPEMAEELVHGVPNAHRVVLDDCGHCPQLQQPEALLGAVELFLGS